MKNPFTLMYGIPSSSVISRDDAINRILKSFMYDESIYMYLITGIRGTGKTVLLRKTSEIISKSENWITIDLNPQADLITSLANKLYNQSKAKKFLEGWQISINLPYLTITKEHGEKISDPEIISEDIIARLAKTNKKILITIDEVNTTQSFRQFANFYQALIGKGLPVYLLMTGLKENINSIINDKSMTFLSRAPKIELEPLSLPIVALEYKNIFNLDDAVAIEMAKLTNGYAFAYQVLGFLFFEKEKRVLDASFINEYDKYLWNNGYNKFWNDLSDKDRKFLIALASTEGQTKNEIINIGSFNENSYSQYRRRLIEKGLIVADAYNHLSFVLPRFREYILFIQKFE